MGNPFEWRQTSSQKSETNTSEQERNPSKLDVIKMAIENKIGGKLPEDGEAWFRNFDKLVPKEVDHINFAYKVNPEDQHLSLHRYTREGIKKALEEELYGATMEDVENYFTSQEEALLKKIERILEITGGKDTEELKKLDRERNEIVELRNQLNFGNPEIPLANIEIRFREEEISKSEADNLRKLAIRLSGEIYKDKPQNEVTPNHIKTMLEEGRQYFTRDDINKDDRDYNNKKFRKLFEDFDKGNTDSVLEEVDFSIGWIQSVLEDRKNKDLKKIAEEALKQRYGENFMHAVIKELEKLRTYRKFLYDKQKKSEKFSDTKEKTASGSTEQPIKPEKQKREKLEGEKLFQYQIENNSHPKAKGLKEDMIFFIQSVDRGISKPGDFQSLKEELSELLYRCDVEYVDGKETKIDEKDKALLQSVLDFRREMDSWNTLSETRVANFRKRLIEYMEDVFGIETQEPMEGEKYDGKKMKATKIEETKNEFLDYKIKRVHSYGYQINEKLFDYYKKWIAEKEQEMKKKWSEMKSSVSRAEFDKITDQDQGWLRQHGFTKSIRPAWVEIYRYKA